MGRLAAQGAGNLSCSASVDRQRIARWEIPARLFPIFRDREELPVSADLPSNINAALRGSRYLIVVCSPRAAQSRWVGEEIKAFKKLGREDRILALIINGEPNAIDGKPGFAAGDECFSEPMRYRLGADGQFSSERTEPIAADVREGKDGKNNAKLKLLAGLLGVNYDELKQARAGEENPSSAYDWVQCVRLGWYLCRAGDSPVLQGTRSASPASFGRTRADGNRCSTHRRGRLQ